MVLPSLRSPIIFAFSGFEGAKRHRLCLLGFCRFGCVLTGDSGSADQMARRWAWILLGPAVSAACPPVLWYHSMLGLVPNGAAKPLQPHPSLLLAGSKVPNGTGSADQMATRLAWILLGFCRFGCVPTGTMVPLDAWAQWCCQAFAAPSIFAFSGFEGAKRHRLCRPTGNPFGLNLAMVPLDA